ncbi:MAG: hypothetical protein AAGD28_32500, partial [Bacteroidota bacterium]
SLPIPLFIRLEDQRLFMQAGGITNFDLEAIREQYHLVVISMPHTPVIADQQQLGQNFAYGPDPAKPGYLSREFREADYLENYVLRAQKVMDFLYQQDWVDTSSFVLAGHSQGSKVAASLAKVDKRVSHLGLFAPNPFGRIDQFIREARLEVEKGNKDWEDANQVMEETYEFFRLVLSEEGLEKHPEFLAWRSFSYPFYQDWLKLNIPIYLAYGTEDRSSDLCDIIPLFFIQAGKENLSFHRYPYLEHNFFEVEEGTVNYEKAHWPEVMNAFVEWSLEN